LSPQELTISASPAVETLGRLLGAHSALTRELSAQLVADYGLTLNEYEVLLLLSQADDRRMRRTDLAAEVRLSPSGITRMLDRMEGQALVEKASCPSDARVTYAVLTGAGARKLAECAPAHMEAVDRNLTERLSAKEIATLGELLSRFTDRDPDCTPGA
jgi:MarR family 2-MHQ and catechol resistance regulon transcriptional repressor